jgi:hypothetical protein
VSYPNNKATYLDADVRLPTPQTGSHRDHYRGDDAGKLRATASQSLTFR